MQTLDQDLTSGLPANGPITKDVERFTGAERLLHWSTALAVLFLLITGALIWQHADDWEIAGINVISQSHVWLGGLLLIGGTTAYALLRHRRIPFARQRFALKQKLGLRMMQGLLVVMTSSGTVLYLREFITMSKPFRSLVRQVHFWSMVPILAFVTAHLLAILLVPRNRGLLRGMITGRVARKVAQRVSPQWLQRLEAGE